MNSHSTIGYRPWLPGRVFLSVSLVLGATMVMGHGRSEKPNAISQTKPQGSSMVVGSGEVRPTRYVNVMSEISGRIEQVYVNPGQEVTKGQALLLIEPQSRESRRVTQYSPLKGVVADISTHVSATVLGRPTGATLMTIADMSRIYVEVNVDGPDISKVAVGQSAKIIVDAFHEEKIRGFVINKNSLPVAQSENPEFRVTIQIRDIPNGIRKRLRPGMSATALITSQTKNPTTQNGAPISPGPTLPGRAAPACKKQSIGDLVKAIAKAYETKTLGTLDAQKPYSGRVRIVIEHSLAGDNDKGRFVIRSFASLAKAEAWLKSREHAEMPGRATKPFVRCAKGVCTYNFDGGIVHNTLYLKKITYGSRSGCPYIKTIYLLDGD
jgi:Barrel-sandwich domain of CusB or HlyD membrane-fusion